MLHRRLPHLLAALALVAAAPADKFNQPGQRRTRTCVQMKGPVVPLRFADGKPTGFFVRADDPSQQGRKRPCGAGFMEIDAHETLKTSDGVTLYFHPGGGPDHYNDHKVNGQYGHIAATDLASRPRLRPSASGRRFAPSGAAYFVAPTRIPRDMAYKANVRNGRSSSAYATYGNPGHDKTDGRGDWTYLTWSWLQNGGARYPDNILPGGGMVRALAKRDMRLAAAGVEPIIGVSYGEGNQPNGRVTAVYGRVMAGPGEGGSPIFGWLVHSYQRQGELIVPCLRRGPASGPAKSSDDAAKPRAADPLVRMAHNLLYELPVDPATAGQRRADLTKRYAEQTDALARMEILTELSRVDDASIMTTLVELLAKEQNPRVREQGVVLLAFMRTTADDVKPAYRAMLQLFRRSADKPERLRIIDAASIVPAPESVILLREIAKSLPAADQDSELHLAVAHSVYRLAPRTKLDEQLVAQVRANLKTIARHGAFSRRLEAIRLLAAPDWIDRPLLAELLVTEKSPVIRTFLTKATGLPPPSP